MGVPTVEEVADFEGALNAFRRALEEEEEETSLAEDIGAGSAAFLGVGIAPKAELGDSQKSVHEDWDVETGQDEWGDEEDAMELSGLDLDDEEADSLAPVADAKASAAVLEAAAEDAPHRTSGFEIATPDKSAEAVSNAAAPCGDGESDTLYVGRGVKDHSVPPSPDAAHVCDHEEDRNKLSVPEMSETQDLAGLEGFRVGPYSGADGSDDLMEATPYYVNGEEQNEFPGEEREAEMEFAPDDHILTDGEQDSAGLSRMDLDEEEPGSLAPVADVKARGADLESAVEDAVYRTSGFEVAKPDKSKEAVSYGAAPCGDVESDTLYMGREVEDHTVPPSSDAVQLCEREDDQTELNVSEISETQDMAGLEGHGVGPCSGAERSDYLMEATRDMPHSTNADGEEQNECADVEREAAPDDCLLTDRERVSQQDSERLSGLDFEEDPGSFVPVADAKPSPAVCVVAAEDVIHRTSGFGIASPVKSNEAVLIGAAPCSDGESNTIYMGREVQDRSVPLSSDAGRLGDPEEDRNKVNELEISETQDLDSSKECHGGPYSGAEGSDGLMEAISDMPHSTNANGEEQEECTGVESEGEMQLEPDLDLLTDRERISQQDSARLSGLDLDEEEPGSLALIADAKAITLIFEAAMEDAIHSPSVCELATDAKPSTAVSEAAVEDAIHRTPELEIPLPVNSEEAVSIGAALCGDGESDTLYMGSDVKDQSVLSSSDAVHLRDREEDQGTVNVSKMSETQDLAFLPEFQAGSHSRAEGSSDLMEATPGTPHSTLAVSKEQNNECAGVESEAKLGLAPDDHLLTGRERVSRQDSARLDELAKAAVLRTVFGDMDEPTVSTDGDDCQNSSSSEDGVSSVVDHTEDDECAGNMPGTHVLGTSPVPLVNLSVFLNGRDMATAPTENFIVGSWSGARDEPDFGNSNLSAVASFLDQSDKVQKSTPDGGEMASDCIMKSVETVETSSPRQSGLQVCGDASQPVLGGARDAPKFADFSLSSGTSFLDQSDMVQRSTPDGGDGAADCIMTSVESVEASSPRQNGLQDCRDASQPVIECARDAPNTGNSNLSGGGTFLDQSGDMVLRGSPDGEGRPSDRIMEGLETVEASSPLQNGFRVCRDDSLPVLEGARGATNAANSNLSGGVSFLDQADMVQRSTPDGGQSPSDRVMESVETVDASSPRQNGLQVCRNASQPILGGSRDAPNINLSGGGSFLDQSGDMVLRGSSDGERRPSDCVVEDVETVQASSPLQDCCEMDLSLTVGLQDTRTNTNPFILRQNVQGTPGLHRVNSRSMTDEQLPGEEDFDTHLSLHIESSTLHMQPVSSAECHGGSDTVNWEVTTMSPSSSQPFSQVEGENEVNSDLRELPAIEGTAGGEIPSTGRSELGEHLGSSSDALPVSSNRQVYYEAEGEMIGITDSRVASSQEGTEGIDLPADGKVEDSDGLSSEPPCSSYLLSAKGNILTVPEAECERAGDLDFRNDTTDDGDVYGDLPTHSELQNIVPAGGSHSNESASKPFTFHQQVEIMPVLHKVTGVSANFDEHFPRGHKSDMDSSRHIGPLESYSGAPSTGASAGTFGAISSSKPELVGDAVADRISLEENLVTSSPPKGSLANIPKHDLHLQTVCSSESPGISETINWKAMAVSLGNSSSLSMVENVQVDTEENIDLANVKGTVNTGRALADEKVEMGLKAGESSYPVVSVAQDLEVAPGAEEVDIGCEGLIVERKVPNIHSSVAECVQKEECGRSDCTDSRKVIAGDGAAGRDVSSDGEPTLGNTRVYSELRALMDLVKAQSSPHEKTNSGSENDGSARLLDIVALQATLSDTGDSLGNKGKQECVEALSESENWIDPSRNSPAEAGRMASEESNFDSFHSDSLVVDLGLPVTDGQVSGAMLQYVDEGAVSTVIQEETISIALPDQQKDSEQIAFHEEGQIAEGLGSSAGVPVLNVAGSSNAAATSQGSLVQPVGQTAEHPIIDLNASDASIGPKTRGRKRGAAVQTYKPRKKAAKEPVPAVNGTEGPQPARATRRRPVKDAQVTGIPNSGTGSVENQLPFGTWAPPMNLNWNPVEIANVQDKPKVRLKVLARKGAQAVQSQHSGPALTPVSLLPALAQSMVQPVGTQSYHFPFYPHPASVWPMRLMDPGIVASGPTPTSAETQGPAFQTQSGPPTADRQVFPVLESATIPSASQPNRSLTPAGYSLPPPSLGWPFAPRLDVHPSGSNQWVHPPGPNHTPPQEVEKPSKRKPRRKAQASVPGPDVEPSVADGNEPAGADGRRKRQRRATGELNFSQLQQDIHRVRSIISRRLEAWGSHSNLLQVPGGGDKGAGDLHLIFDEEQREEFVQKMVTSCQSNPRTRALFLGAVRRIADYSVLKTAASQSPCQSADDVVTAWEQMKLQPSASSDPFYRLCKAVDTLHKEGNDSLDELLAIQDPEFALLNRTADGKWDVRIPPPVGKPPVVKASRKGVDESGKIAAAASNIPASS